MTSVFDFTDYREFLRAYIKKQPRQGWGLVQSWAGSLRVHSTYLSQILGASKEMSLEIAESLAQILNLSPQETEYFLELVQHSRAGTTSLKNYFRRRIEKIQQERDLVERRVRVDTEFDDSIQGTFYSSVLYSKARNLCALKDINDAETLATRMDIPLPLTKELVEFLLKHGLIVKDPQGLKIGPRRTHIKAGTPNVIRHHQNWRLEGLQKMTAHKADDLFFTFPMSLSLADTKKIRKKY